MQYHILSRVKIIYYFVFIFLDFLALYDAILSYKLIWTHCVNETVSFLIVGISSLKSTQRLILSTVLRITISYFFAMTLYLFLVSFTPYVHSFYYAQLLKRNSQQNQNYDQSIESDRQMVIIMEWSTELSLSCGDQLYSMQQFFLLVCYPHSTQLDRGRVLDVFGTPRLSFMGTSPFTKHY